MVQAYLAALAVFALLAMSLRANRKFKDEDRLPMQWSFSSSVNWTDPRPIALALTPVLATVILLAAVASTLVLEPRSGQEGFEVPTILFIAFVFIGAHALHLRLVGKSLRRNG